jgi:hypothetical protein
MLLGVDQIKGLNPSVIHIVEIVSKSTRDLTGGGARLGLWLSKGPLIGKPLKTIRPTPSFRYGYYNNRAIKERACGNWLAPWILPVLAH